MIIIYILVALLIYASTIALSIKLDNLCEKLDPHHNESPLWLLPPGFNIIIQLIFLLIIKCESD